MFVLFGRKAKVKPKRGGRRERRKCPECGQTTDFVEADEHEAFHVFFVELYSGDDIVFVCTACGEAMAWEETEAPSLSGRQKEKVARTQEKERAKRKAALAKESARRDREVDSELAALKRKMDLE